MNKVYIVLFKDGSMMPTRIKPEKGDYQKDARFFETDEKTTLSDISNWYWRGNPNSLKIKEQSK